MLNESGIFKIQKVRIAKQRNITGIKSWNQG